MNNFVENCLQILPARLYDYAKLAHYHYRTEPSDCYAATLLLFTLDFDIHWLPVSIAACACFVHCLCLFRSLPVPILTLACILFGCCLCLFRSLPVPILTLACVLFDCCLCLL